MGKQIMFADCRFVRANVSLINGYAIWYERVQDMLLHEVIANCITVINKYKY